MRGKEKLIPHSDRVGRWLGWLTVWSNLSIPVPRCLLCPGCEFGVCEIPCLALVWPWAAAEAVGRSPLVKLDRAGVVDSLAEGGEALTTASGPSAAFPPS